jgi:hypothetical protein
MVAMLGCPTRRPRRIYRACAARDSGRIIDVL